MEIDEQLEEILAKEDIDALKALMVENEEEVLLCKLNTISIFVKEENLLLNAISNDKKKIWQFMIDNNYQLDKNLLLYIIDKNNLEVFLYLLENKPDFVTRCGKFIKSKIVKSQNTEMLKILHEKRPDLFLESMRIELSNSINNHMKFFFQIILRKYNFIIVDVNIYKFCTIFVQNINDIRTPVITYIYKHFCFKKGLNEVVDPKLIKDEIYQVSLYDEAIKFVKLMHQNLIKLVLINEIYENVEIITIRINEILANNLVEKILKIKNSKYFEQRSLFHKEHLSNNSYLSLDKDITDTILSIISGIDEKDIQKIQNFFPDFKEIALLSEQNIWDKIFTQILDGVLLAKKVKAGGFICMKVKQAIEIEDFDQCKLFFGNDTAKYLTRKDLEEIRALAIERRCYSGVNAMINVLERSRGALITPP